MWIRWKYSDHGWPDWQELEVPKEWRYQILEYLEERELVPTWSERYLAQRIEWELIDVPAEATLDELIRKQQLRIERSQAELRRLEAQKRKYYGSGAR